MFVSRQVFGIGLISERTHKSHPVILLTAKAFKTSEKLVELNEPEIADPPQTPSQSIPVVQSTPVSPPQHTPHGLSTPVVFPGPAHGSSVAAQVPTAKKARATSSFMASYKLYTHVLDILVPSEVSFFFKSNYIRFNLYMLISP
jgi:hypothetical protein